MSLKCMTYFFKFKSPPMMSEAQVEQTKCDMIKLMKQVRCPNDCPTLRSATDHVSIYIRPSLTGGRAVAEYLCVDVC
jgi:hypothetical protein